MGGREVTQPHGLKMVIPVRSLAWNDDIRDEMGKLWEECVITDPKRFGWDIKQMIAGKGQYLRIGAMADGVPWWVVGVLHGLECSYDFGKHLHNGDSLMHRTVHVPAGRPRGGMPPYSFQESAVDALVYDKLHKVSDWSIEHALWRLEGFNGHGYRMLSKPIHSPYLWAGTNHYTKGKYIRDHVYSPSAVSTQSGSAGLLKILQENGEL